MSLTKFIRLGSHLSSYISGDFPYIGEWWVNKPFIKVFLSNLISQGFRC